jgi:hypothetical protein
MTNHRLEKIVSGFSLRLIEVVHGKFQDGSSVLRFDFVAKDDNGKLFVGGSCATKIDYDMNPRQFANKLRETADALDAYWERAFPTAKEETDEWCCENGKHLGMQICPQCYEMSRAYSSAAGVQE